MKPWIDLNGRRDREISVLPKRSEKEQFLR
jgi:hypothetical protein